MLWAILLLTTLQPIWDFTKAVKGKNMTLEDHIGHSVSHCSPSCGLKTLPWSQITNHHELERMKANQQSVIITNHGSPQIIAEHSDHHSSSRNIHHCHDHHQGTSWSVSGSNLTLVALVNIQILGQWMSNGCSSPVCLRYLVKWYQLPDLSHFGISCHFYLASEKERKKDEKG